MKKNKTLLNFIQKRYIWFFLLFIIFQSGSLLLMFEESKHELYNKRVDEVSSLLMDSIGSPIVQGSNLEAIQRLRSAVDKGFITCFVFLSPFKFNSCNQTKAFYQKVLQTDRHGSRIKIELYFKENLTSINPGWYLVITFLTIIFFILFNSISITSLQQKIRSDFNSILDLERSEDIQKFNFDEFKQVSLLVNDLFFQKTKLETDKAAVQIAKKVAHDIRSPLAVLEIISSEVNLGNEESDLLKKSIQRIRAITNDLLNSGPTVSTDNELICINDSVDQMITEKNIRYRNQNIILKKTENLTNQIFFCNGDDEKFKRVISNLVDNSIDAGASNVFFSCNEIDNKLNFSISDNGRGISNNLLPTFLTGDFKSTKIKGNGIGLKSSAEWIKSINGELNIESEQDKGTNIHLLFPRFKYGSRLRIKLEGFDCIVIIDDESYIIDLWNNHLAGKDIPIPIKYLTKKTEIENVLSEQGRRFIVFTDFDLNDNYYTGSKLATDFPAHKYILTTSSYTDNQTHIEANKFDMLILPKPMITQISFI